MRDKGFFCSTASAMSSAGSASLCRSVHEPRFREKIAIPLLCRKTVWFQTARARARAHLPQW